MTKHLARDVAEQDKALIFIHIPKAAGTTLHGILERQFTPEAIFSLSGTDAPGSIKEFINLPKADRERIRLLKGHMPYGLHKYLGVPADYITVLRDPVDRIISHYSHVLNSSHHYLHAEVTSRRMNLPDFISSGLSTELTNDQTRLISGVGKVNTRLLDGEERRTLRASQEPVTAEILQIAKKNLQSHFAVVGLFSRFDESLLLFKRRLGWGSIYYVPRNVARVRSDKQQVPGEVRNLIAKYNEMDAELYECARQKYEEAVKEQGADFQRELRSFERNNRVYGKAWQVSELTRRGFPKVKTMLRKKQPGSARE